MILAGFRKTNQSRGLSEWRVDALFSLLGCAAAIQQFERSELNEIDDKWLVYDRHIFSSS